MAVFERAYMGEWDNWDVQATFTIWKNDDICIVPNGNLVTNIGFDERAVNTKQDDDPMANLPFRPMGAIVHPTNLAVHQEYDIRAFDEYVSWMSDYAKTARYRRLPFYRVMKRIYRAIR